MVVAGFIYWRKQGSKNTKTVFATVSPTYSGGVPIEALRRFDPNFSDITFRDFLYSLYGRAHHARGAGELMQYTPYLSPAARAALGSRGSGAVSGVIVGALHVRPLQGLETPQVAVPVTFESNMTEGGTSWYVQETWTLERKRDILSPPPEKAKADHCPRCGAPLQTRTDGACNYCGVKINGGEFQWYVRRIDLTRRENRGPQLTSFVPEMGTNAPTVRQANFANARAIYESEHPDFAWDAFTQHVRSVATTLQDAWTARDWERVRPLETEGLFQMHRYWIDAYRQQKLQNIVEGFTITNVEPVKIDRDAFYESITVRLWAEGRDYTVDESGTVRGGAKGELRRWTEYWTFIRSRAAAGAPESCPNCGAKVAVGNTGVCEFCGGKITSGTFDWILSRIEQDESYAG
jgi:ribosomal protein L37AE/L43A